MSDVSWRRAALLLAGGLALGRGVGEVLRTAGASDEEVAATLAGDDVLPHARSVTTRARTLPAPPDDVWPWLVQMGWGRAGWYSLDALEALVGAARSTAADGTVSWRSLWEVVPAHQQLAVGDRVPLNHRTGFEVLAVEPGRHLVLGLRVGGPGWSGGWCWAFVLRAHAAGTRLLVRTHVDARPQPLALLSSATLDPGHAVMELLQLHNIARRVG